ERTKRQEFRASSMLHTGSKIPAKKSIGTAGAYSISAENGSEMFCRPLWETRSRPKTADSLHETLQALSMRSPRRRCCRLPHCVGLREWFPEKMAVCEPVRVSFS